MSNNENNHEFGMNQPNNNEPQQTPQEPANNNYSSNFNQQNNQNDNGWVFSEQQKQASEQPNNAYSSKYSYSSYENAQSGHSYQNPNAQRQNSGPAYDNGYGKQEESYRWNYEDYQNQQARNKKPKKNRGLKIFAGILGGIACVAVLTLAGFGVASLVQSNRVVEEEVAPQEVPAPAVAVEPNLTLTDKPEEAKEILADGKLTIPQRAEKVKASVVGIVNYQQSAGSYYSTEAGQGSGIIMSEDGYIITNAHVIEGAMGLKVVLSDGTEYAAQIVGSDTQTDLAVIKVEATGLTSAEFGNSDQLEVGEQLIAVGNPTGLELGSTLTVGYVSALNRQIDATSGLNYIQTDAAINPGNSGGALANEYGQVIGINSAKISGSDYEGLGFAISINDAQPIIDDLINYGYVKGRVRMGIGVYEMDAFMAQLNNTPQGLVVASIDAGTPAASSGLVPGDIITAIDGQDITLFDDIASMLEGKKPGDTVVLSVFRRTQGFPDKELTIEVGLIESVSTQAQVQNNYASGDNGSNNSGNSGNPGNYGGYGNYGGFNPFGSFGSYFGIQ